MISPTTPYSPNRSSEEIFEEMKQLFEQMTNTNNFSRVGRKLKLISVAPPESLLLELLVEEEHVNGKLTLHGGQTAALVDIVTARAVGMSVRNIPMVSLDLSVSYMLPVRIGEIISIEAICLKIGRNIAFTEAVFRRKSDGKLVAKGQHKIAFIYNHSSSNSFLEVKQF